MSLTKSLRIALTAAFVVAVMLSSNVPVTAAAGKIRGTITDKNTGQPVADACVTLGPPIRCFGQFGTNPGLHTNAVGYYEIDLDALAANDGGQWDLYFLKTGYENLYSGVFTSNGGFVF